MYDQMIHYRQDIRDLRIVLVPSATVSMCIGKTIELMDKPNDVSGSQLPKGEIVPCHPSSYGNGHIYCCLPSQISTLMPVHIDARWELTRDRNNFKGGMCDTPVYT